MGVDVAEAVAGDGFLHRALLYRGTAEFRAAIERYVRGGLARAEPVLIATPPGKVSWLRRDLSGGVPGLAFTDMTELGRNPARIIPAIRAVIADRLAGYRVPAGDRPGGQGLWLVNQVCDLVELRTSTGGTTICLHMRLR